MTTGPLNDLGLTEKKNDPRLAPDAAGGCGVGCGCGHGASSSNAQATSAGLITSTLGVSGMTCGHCVSAVTTELGALEGVESVDVLLNAQGVSRVTVTSATVLDPDAVSAAVDEAGYDLVDAD